MPRAVPSFPALDDWQKMSEREQDALLDAMEKGHRRGRLVVRVVIGLVGTAAIAAIGVALLSLW